MMPAELTVLIICALPFVIPVALVLYCMRSAATTGSQHWTETENGLFLESDGLYVRWLRGQREPNIEKAPGANGNVAIKRRRGSRKVSVVLTNGPFQRIEGEFDWSM